MTIMELTQALLETSAVVAVVPGDRIKSPGPWQNLPRPYVIHEPAGVERTRTVGEGLVGRFWSYQVAAVADSRSQVTDLATKIVQSLDGTHGDATYFAAGEEYSYESDTKLHRAVVGFDIFEYLS